MKIICVLCKKKKKKKLHYRFKGFKGELICGACYKAMNKKECYVCHRIRVPQINTKEGPACYSCSKSKKGKFIRKFINLPFEEAVLFIARGITEKNEEFLKKIKYLKETTENRKKLREIFYLMNKFSSGQRILANFFRTEEGERFSQIIY